VGAKGSKIRAKLKKKFIVRELIKLAITPASKTLQEHHANIRREPF